MEARPTLRYMERWLAKLPADQLLPEAQRLVRELQLIHGVGHTPSRGCSFLTTSLDDAEVTVEYEFSAGYPGRYSGPPENCYPDEPDEVCITQVLINGYWIEPTHFAESVVERWCEEAIQDATSRAQDARDDARIEAYRDRMEAA